MGWEAPNGNTIIFPADRGAIYDATRTSDYNGIAYHWKMDETSEPNLNQVTIDSNLQSDLETDGTFAYTTGVDGNAYNRNTTTNEQFNTTATAAIKKCTSETNTYNSTLEMMVYITGWNLFNNGDGTYFGRFLCPQTFQGGFPNMSAWATSATPSDVDFWFHGNYDSGSESQIGSGTPIPSGQWVHLLGVVDRTAGEIRCYVDGELTDTLSCETARTPIANAWQQIMVMDHTASNQGVLGYVDEVAYWHNVNLEVSDFVTPPAAGGIQPYMMHHMNHNCQKDPYCGLGDNNLLHKPTLQEIEEFNRRN